MRNITIGTLILGFITLGACSTDEDVKEDTAVETPRQTPLIAELTLVPTQATLPIHLTPQTQQRPVTPPTPQ